MLNLQSCREELIPIAPYIPVRYTALHRNKNSSISQVMSKRIDHARPVLFLIGDGKDFGAQ